MRFYRREACVFALNNGRKLLFGKINVLARYAEALKNVHKNAGEALG